MKKMLAVLFAVLGFVFGRHAYSFVKELMTEPSFDSTGIASAEWIDTVELPGGIILDTPMQLQAGGGMGGMPAESASSSIVHSFSNEELSIGVAATTYAPEYPLDLDRGVEGAISAMDKVSETDVVSVQRHRIRLLGDRAVEVVGSIDRGQGRRMGLKAVYFLRERTFYQVVLMADEARHGDLLGSWDRIRGSIRYGGEGARPDSSGGSVRPGSPGLPPGMERR